MKMIRAEAKEANRSPLRDRISLPEIPSREGKSRDTPPLRKPPNPGNVSPAGSFLRRRGPGRSRPKKFGTGNDVHARGKIPV